MELRSYKRQKLGFSINPVSPLQQPRGSRRNRRIKQISDGSYVKKSRITRFETLPVDILISILSLLPLKEAVRASVLSRKWRYLWQFTYGNLEFVNASCYRGNFVEWVNRVLKLHQGSEMDQFMIRFVYYTKDKSTVDSWINHAMQKKIKGFQLEMIYYSKDTKYDFPDLKTLSSTAFLSLKSLRFANVAVKEEAIHYFLSSCQYIEELSLDGSDHVKNLKVVDPLPHFKVLEISNCCKIQSLEISVKNPVSLTYVGKLIQFDNAPNLKELTLGGGTYCTFFIFKSNRRFYYPVHLEKLVLKVPPATFILPPVVEPPDFPDLRFLKQLELEIVFNGRQSILFVLQLIKAAPFLQRFRLKIQRFQHKFLKVVRFPELSASEATGFVHNHLKVVEMSGYISHEVLVMITHLHKIAPSLERLDIDIDIDNMYYWLPGPRPAMYQDYLTVETREKDKLKLLSSIELLKDQIFPPHIKTSYLG